MNCNKTLRKTYGVYSHNCTGSDTSSIIRNLHEGKNLNYSPLPPCSPLCCFTDKIHLKETGNWLNYAFHS